MLVKDLPLLDLFPAHHVHAPVREVIELAVNLAISDVAGLSDLDSHILALLSRNPAGHRDFVNCPFDVLREVAASCHVFSEQVVIVFERPRSTIASDDRSWPTQSHSGSRVHKAITELAEVVSARASLIVFRVMITVVTEPH